MRTLLTLIFIAGFMSVAAQMPIEVKIESRPSSLGIQTAFEVLIPQATTNDAIDLWKKTIIPGGLFKKEPKMEKVKDEWIVNNVLISDITNLPLNVFTQVTSFPGNIYVRIFLQSEGGFLGSSGSSPETTDAAVRFIRNYAVDLYRKTVEKELKVEQKNLKELENDLSKLTKQNKSYNRKISEAQKDERELKVEAVQNEELLKNQENVIELDNPEGKGKTYQEQLEKQAKDTEKDLNKAQKSQKKFNRKVNKNEKAQREKSNEIEKQKIRVEEVKTKLNNIR